MNVYDFDGTIYRGNSFIDFFCFLYHENKEIRKHALAQLLNLTRLCLNLYDVNKHPSLSNFILEVQDLDKNLINFWDKNYKKLMQWYKEIHKEEDVVITSSLEYLVKPACNILNIKNLIGTKIDLNTGQIIGKVCIGAEKLNRYKEKYGQDTIIDNFYTNSLRDKPLMNISKDTFILRRGKIIKTL